MLKYWASLFFTLCSFAVVSADFAPVLNIYENPEILGRACAERLRNIIVNNHSQHKPTVLGLATGSTPIPVYKAFIQLVHDENIDLSDVITFNLDEYVGLPSNDPHSYYSFMFEYLFSELLESLNNPRGIRLQNIHILQGCAKNEADLNEEEILLLQKQFPNRAQGARLTENEEKFVLLSRANDYESLIASLGPIDIQILGIGTNGHIGFSEPGCPFTGITSLTALTENTRKDNARFFDNDISQVPTHALSMGIATILNAKEVFLLATGTAKTNIIQRTLHESISTAIPATALRLHPKCEFFLDHLTIGQ